MIPTGMTISMIAGQVMLVDCDDDDDDNDDDYLSRPGHACGLPTLPTPDLLLRVMQKLQVKFT